MPGRWPVIFLACCLALSACKKPKARSGGGGGPPVPPPFGGEMHGAAVPANDRTDLRIVTVTNVVTDYRLEKIRIEERVPAPPPVSFSTNISIAASNETSSSKSTGDDPRSGHGAANPESPISNTVSDAAHPTTTSTNSESHAANSKSGSQSPAAGTEKSESLAAKFSPEKTQDSSSPDSMPPEKLRKCSERERNPIALQIGGASNHASQAATPLSLSIPVGTQPTLRDQATPLSVPIGSGSGAATRNDRAALPLRLPAAAQAANNQSIGSPRIPSGAAQTVDGKPAASSLQIWNGIGGHGATTNGDGRPQGNPISISAGGQRTEKSRDAASSIAFDVARGTNTPAGGMPAQPILVDPILAKNGSATNWRDEQLARQAEQEKTRVQEWSRLRLILHRWLMLSDSDRDN